MRFFLGCALVIFVAVGAARAQEGGRVVTFDVFVKALTNYENNERGEGIFSMDFSTSMKVLSKPKAAPYVSLVKVAEKDESLAKAPMIRAKTLAILAQLDAIEAFDSVTRAEAERIGRRVKLDNERKAKSNDPQKFSRSDIDMMNLQNSYFTKFYQMMKANKADLEALRKLRTTPEAQQFAMSENDAFFAGLRPYDSAMGGAAMPRPLKVEDTTGFEVVSTAPGGFYGYLMVPDVVGNFTKRDAAGNAKLVVDRSKNVYVRGYVKPFSVGEIIRAKATAGEMKTINGVAVQEFFVVAE